MLPHQTESLPDHAAIDAVTPAMAVQMMLNGQVSAMKSVATANLEITQAAALMAATIASGGTLVYAAAGSSGLMALADVCELPGTFGIAPEQLRLHMAGGVPADGHMPGQTEDDTAEADLIASTLSKSDCVIVLSASGTTPYPIAIAQKAAARGAKVIAIANNAATPLLNSADIAICLPTPPEVLAGSTRLGAGTAQKVALNMMSTLMGVQLGHVYRGRMVNLIADNAKLRSRAALIVSDLAQVSLPHAHDALETATGDVKLAILIAKGLDKDSAKAALRINNGHLGPCLNKNETI
ncbi:MAG: N-acetylmuramic acid 6-phosphate etherase [Sulfitobacter sp.]